MCQIPQEMEFIFADAAAPEPIIDMEDVDKYKALRHLVYALTAVGLACTYFIHQDISPAYVSATDSPFVLSSSFFSFSFLSHSRLCETFRTATQVFQQKDDQSLNRTNKIASSIQINLFYVG